MAKNFTITLTPKYMDDEEGEEVGVSEKIKEFEEKFNVDTMYLSKRFYDYLADNYEDNGRSMSIFCEPSSDECVSVKPGFSRSHGPIVRFNLSFRGKRKSVDDKFKNGHLLIEYYDQIMDLLKELERKFLKYLNGNENDDLWTAHNLTKYKHLVLLKICQGLSSGTDYPCITSQEYNDNLGKDDVIKYIIFLSKIKEKENKQ